MDVRSVAYRQRIRHSLGFVNNDHFTSGFLFALFLFDFFHFPEKLSRRFLAGTERIISKSSFLYHEISDVGERITIVADILFEDIAVPVFENEILAEMGPSQQVELCVFIDHHARIIPVVVPKALPDVEGKGKGQENQSRHGNSTVVEGSRVSQLTQLISPPFRETANTSSPRPGVPNVKNPSVRSEFLLVDRFVKNLMTA